MDAGVLRHDPTGMVLSCLMLVAIGAVAASTQVNAELPISHHRNDDNTRAIIENIENGRILSPPDHHDALDQEAKPRKKRLFKTIKKIFGYFMNRKIDSEEIFVKSAPRWNAGRKCKSLDGKKSYKKGEKWIEKSFFWMRCKITLLLKSNSEPFACVDRYGEEVKVGESFDEGRQTFACVTDGKGVMAIARLSPEAFPMVYGGQKPFALLIQDRKREMSPIILVPGSGGSRVEADVSKESEHAGFFKMLDSVCARNYSQFQIWPSPMIALPNCLTFWVDKMKLEFNENDKTTSNVPGVDLKFPGFGETSTLEYFMDWKFSLNEYYHQVVKKAVSWGYERDKSIKGAPYDFRKSPNEPETLDYYKRLKKLVEDTYTENYDNKVTLVAHSLGGLYIHKFLTNQNEQDDGEWCRKYIHAFVSLGAPWSGSLQAALAIISGYDLLISFLPGRKLREAQRSWPGTFMMLPKEPVFGKDKPIVVTADGKNYTTADYEALFKKLNYTNIGLQIYEHTKDLVNPTKAPKDVEVYCVVGTGIATPHALQYETGKFPNSQPTQLTSDGDMTVITESAMLCKKWAKEGKQGKVIVKEFPNVNHMGLVSNEAILEYIKSVVVPRHFLYTRYDVL